MPCLVSLLSRARVSHLKNRLRTNTKQTDFDNSPTQRVFCIGSDTGDTKANKFKQMVVEPFVMSDEFKQMIISSAAGEQWPEEENPEFSPKAHLHGLSPINSPIANFLTEYFIGDKIRSL